MKKEYKSPEFELNKVCFTKDILNISNGEGTASGGTVIDPPPDPNDPWSGEEW